MYGQYSRADYIMMYVRYLETKIVLSKIFQPIFITFSKLKEIVEVSIVIFEVIESSQISSMSHEIWNLCLNFFLKYHATKASNAWALPKLWVTARTTDTQRGNSLHCTAENSIPIPNFQVWRQHILSATSAHFFRYL